MKLEPDEYLSKVFDIQIYVSKKLEEINRAIDEQCWKQLDDTILITLYKGCKKEIDLRGLRGRL